MVLVKILIAPSVVKRQNVKTLLTKKNAKITKRSHAYKDYGSSYIADILNSFNPELQLKNSESAIRNKLMGLMTELKGFKFVMTLVIEFKKIESKDATKYTTFYLF